VSSISINKNLKDATSKLHSYGWRVKWIDGEQCLYKKLNPTFDVEVSGINNRKTRNYSVNVFVWEITPDIKIVDSYTELSSLDQVVSTLLEIEERYKQ